MTRFSTRLRRLERIRTARTQDGTIEVRWVNEDANGNRIEATELTFGGSGSTLIA